MVTQADVLTDAMPEVIQDMVADGQKRGYLTYDDLNNTLPDNWVEPDKVDVLLVHLEAVGVEIVESARTQQAKVKFAEDTKPSWPRATSSPPSTTPCRTPAPVVSTTRCGCT